MALPKITHNSPAAGSISWTATGIVFAGTNYTISAGSTSKKFVWWEYLNGAPVLRDGDELPELASEDVLLFLNKGGIGTVVPTTDVVDGSLLVSGTVMAGAIAADQIQTWHLKSDAVTTEKLAAGSVTATEILSGAVTAEKLSIGAVGDSKVLNGSFEDGVAGWYVQENSAGTGTADVVTGVASSGRNALRIARTASATTSWTGVETDVKYRIPVTAVTGRKWYVAARVGSGTSASTEVRAQWWKADGTASATPMATVGTATATSAWALLEGQVTPPTDARFMSIRLYNKTANSMLYVDEVTAREVVVSAQIGDGQITTPNLSADAVTAEKIKSGSINTGHMVANSINADRLVANSITAAKLSGDAIDGKTITGAKIQSNPAANRGLKWVDAGLKAYDSTGVERFAIDANTGDLTARGQVSSYDGGNIASLTMIHDQTGATRPGVSLGYDSTTHDPPILFGASANETTSELGSYGMFVGSGLQRTGGDRSQMVLRAGGEWSLAAAGEGAMAGQGIYQVDDRNSTTRTKGRNMLLQADNVMTNGKVEAAGLKLGGYNVTPTQIAHYVSTGAMGSGTFTTGQLINAPVYQQAGSTVNLGSPAHGQITLSETGLYSFTYSMNLYSNSAMTGNKPSTGRSFVDISDINGASYSRTGIPVEEDVVTGTHGGMFLGAGTVIKFNFYQTSGTVTYYRARIWITKHF